MPPAKVCVVDQNQSWRFLWDGLEKPSLSLEPNVNDAGV
jgi:hypothetical protein